MEILILGFVLIILGVGATFAFDKIKAEREASNARRAAMPPKPVPAPKVSRPRPGPKKTRTLQDANEEFLAAFEASMKSKPKRVIKPGSIKAGFYKPGQMPEDTQFMEELFDDVSTNSKLTVQELIAKIEQMKKR